MDLRDSVAVVTGAARGIGQAIAQAYATQGVRVAVVDVLAEPLRATAAQMSGGGAAVLPVIADITDPDQVEGLSARVEGELGPVDVLVNCAGTFSVIGPVWEADPEKWFGDIRVNLFGSFLLCREVVGRMVARQRGRVINIVSSGGVGDPHAHSTSYASSKTGLMRLTEGLAEEVREHGIKVFAVAPPAVLTDMTRFIMEDPDGQRWRPGFSRLFEDGEDAPPQAIADLCVRLARGDADELSGRYLLVTEDLDELVAQAEEIVRRDLWTLRIRRP